MAKIDKNEAFNLSIKLKYEAEQKLRKEIEGKHYCEEPFDHFAIFEGIGKIV